MTEYEIKRLENRIRELWNEKEDLLKEKEELENQNRLLGERCNQLLKDKGELTDQIEKMKCCQNCRKFNNLSYDCTCAEVCNEWELRR